MQPALPILSIPGTTIPWMRGLAPWHAGSGQRGRLLVAIGQSGSWPERCAFRGLEDAHAAIAPSVHIRSEPEDVPPGATVVPGHQILADLRPVDRMTMLRGMDRHADRASGWPMPDWSMPERIALDRAMRTVAEDPAWIPDRLIQAIGHPLRSEAWMKDPGMGSGMHGARHRIDACIRAHAGTTWSWGARWDWNTVRNAIHAPDAGWEPAIHAGILATAAAVERPGSVWIRDGWRMALDPDGSLMDGRDRHAWGDADAVVRRQVMTAVRHHVVGIQATMTTEVAFFIQAADAILVGGLTDANHADLARLLDIPMRALPRSDGNTNLVHIVWSETGMRTHATLVEMPQRRPILGRPRDVAAAPIGRRRAPTASFGASIAEALAAHGRTPASLAAALGHANGGLVSAVLSGRRHVPRSGAARWAAAIGLVGDDAARFIADVERERASPWVKARLPIG